MYSRCERCGDLLESPYYVLSMHNTVNRKHKYLCDNCAGMVIALIDGDRLESNLDNYKDNL